VLEEFGVKAPDDMLQITYHTLLPAGHDGGAR